jgi:hypothetical protein
MIVCNHIGYIEIVYLVGKRAPSFVAKKAVASAPVIGTITSVCARPPGRKDRRAFPWTPMYLYDGALPPRRCKPSL